MRLYKNMSKIFCVIPAYNEEKNIIKAINEVKPFVNEIVVVDDSSSDKTFELAKKQGVSVLRHIINRGQGAALQTGNDYALLKGADIIVHFDADGQFLANEINDMVKPIVAGEAQVTIGSRFLGRHSNIPLIKRNFIMPIARLVNKIFIGKTLTDPQNGFRALSREVAEKIKITNDGSAHCSEILSKIFKNNFIIKEVPVTVIYNEFGQGLFGGRGRGMGGVAIVKDLIISKLID